MPKVLLLGGSGYVGSAFLLELNHRCYECLAPARAKMDYTRFEVLLPLLRDCRPDFLINAAGYTGKPNVDACETTRADTLQGNTIFPAMLSHACQVAGVPWGHVSSGCIYSGAWVEEDGKQRVEKDLTNPDIKSAVESANDETRKVTLRGFSEEDKPNFSFRDPPCSFYSGTKALGEEALAGDTQAYLWRLRIPFDEFDNHRNYLSKVQRYAKVYDNFNSISHRGDFVQACLELWERRAPFGVYNVTNPGYVTTRHVVDLIQKHLRPNREFEFWESDAEFYKVAAKTPRSNCVLDTTKLVRAGVKMRTVEDALEVSLRNWKPEVVAIR